MNCTDARKAIDALPGTAAAEGGLAEHLRDCELCRQYYGDTLLQRELATLQVPEPEADFLRRAVQRATRRPARRWQSSVAVAASVLVVGLAGLVAYGPERAAQDEGFPVTQVMEQPAFHREEVRIVIHSKEDRDDAELFIELAENLELEGFAGRRTLSWKTSLKKGANLLVLPVLIHNQGGEVRVASRFGDSSHEVTVTVARGRDPLSRLSETLRADGRTI